MAIGDNNRNPMNDDVVLPHVAAAAATAPESTEKHRAETELAELQRRIQFKIIEISNSNLSAADKANLIDRLESALTSGDPNRILVTLLTSQSTQTAEAAEAASFSSSFALYVEENYYPEFTHYSKQAQAFIRKQLAFAIDNSETLRALDDYVSNIDPQTRKDVNSRIAENFNLLKELRADAEAAERYKYALAFFDEQKLARDPNARVILEAMRDGSIDPIEAVREATKLFSKRVAVADKVLKEIKDDLEPETRAFLKAYGNPIDVRPLLADLNKISFEKRNDVLLALDKVGGDISKLLSEDQKIAHVLKVGIAVEAGMSLQAIKGMSVEVVLAKGKDIDGSIRAAAMLEYIKDAGFASGNSDVQAAFARQVILTIDNNPTAAALFKAGDLNGLGEEMKKSIPQGTSLDAALMAFAKQTTAQTVLSGKLEPWQRKDFSDEELAASQQMWAQANSLVQRQLANPTLPVKEAASTLTPQAISEAQRALQSLGDGNEIILQAQPVVATAVVTPLAGINLKDIPPLKGVSGGESVASSHSPTGGKPKADDGLSLHGA